MSFNINFNKMQYSILFFIFFLNLPLISSAQGYEWEILSPKVTNQKLWDVYFTDNDHGWSVGENGTYIRTIDGSNWTAIDLQTEADLFSVFFINSSIGWISGVDGMLLKSIDGGITWDELNTNTTEDLTRIFFLTDQLGWVVGDDGLFLETTDGGINWQSKDTEYNYPWRGVYFLDTEKGFLVGEGRAIKRTTNGGNSWQEIFPISSTIGVDTYFDIWFCDELNGYISGYGFGGVLLYTTDGGDTWDHDGTYSNHGGYSVTCAGQSKVWTVNGDKEVIYSPDGGINFEWQALNTAQRPDMNGIHFVDSLHGWTVGDEGAIFYTENGGNEWMGSNHGFEWGKIFGLYFIDSNNGYAASRTGHMLRTADGGSTWDEHYLGTYIYGFSAIDNHVWTAATEDTVFHSMDGGINWEIQSTGLIGGGFWSGIQEMDFADTLHGFGFTYDSYFVSTSDGGETWATAPIEDVGLPNTVLWEIDFADPLHGWIISSDKRIFKTTDGGQNWYDTQYNLGGTPADIFFIDSQVGWMCGWGGIVAKTTDGGDSWVLLNTSSENSHFDIYFKDNNDGWALGYGSLMYTYDGGDTWEEQLLPEQFEYNTLFFLDGLHGWIGGDASTILGTSPCQANTTKVITNDEDFIICRGEQDDVRFWAKSRHIVYVGGEGPEGPFGDVFFPNQLELRLGDTVDFMWVGTGMYNVNFDFIDQYDYLPVVSAPNIHTIIVDEPTYHFFKSDPQGGAMEGTMITKYMEAYDDLVILDSQTGYIVYFGDSTEWIEGLTEGNYCIYNVNHDGQFEVMVGEDLPEELSGDCYEFSDCLSINIEECYYCEIQTLIRPQTECVDHDDEYSVKIYIDNSSADGPYDVNGRTVERGDSLELYFGAGDEWNVSIQDINSGVMGEDTLCSYHESGSSPDICIYPLVVQNIQTWVNAVETKYIVSFEIFDGTGNYLVDGIEILGNIFESDSIACGVDYIFEVTDDAETNHVDVNGDAPCEPTNISNVAIGDISIFPNPGTDILNIESELFQVFPATVEVFSLNGKKLIELEIPAGTEAYKLKANMLESGVFLCRITFDHYQIIKKIIIE